MAAVLIQLPASQMLIFNVFSVLCLFRKQLLVSQFQCMHNAISSVQTGCQGWKKYQTMGLLAPEKKLIPRKYYPWKNKIVIMY